MESGFRAGMETPKRDAPGAPTRLQRKHDCERDSNKRMISCDWDGDEIVTTFGCRRCLWRWEVRKTSAQIEAEMREQMLASIEHSAPECARLLREES